MAAEEICRSDTGKDQRRVWVCVLVEGLYLGFRKSEAGCAIARGRGFERMARGSQYAFQNNSISPIFKRFIIF
jgi:hypothetical protein